MKRLNRERTIVYDAVSNSKAASRPEETHCSKANHQYHPLLDPNFPSLVLLNFFRVIPDTRMLSDRLVSIQSLSWQNDLNKVSLRKNMYSVPDRIVLWPSVQAKGPQKGSITAPGRTRLYTVKTTQVLTQWRARNFWLLCSKTGFVTSGLMHKIR